MCFPNHGALSRSPAPVPDDSVFKDGITAYPDHCPALTRTQNSKLANSPSIIKQLIDKHKKTAGLTGGFFTAIQS